MYFQREGAGTVGSRIAASTDAITFFIDIYCYIFIVYYIFI